MATCSTIHTYIHTVHTSILTHTVHTYINLRSWTQKGLLHGWKWYLYVKLKVWNSLAIVVCTYIHTYIHTYIQTNIKYIHTYIHTYIHSNRQYRPNPTHTYMSYIHTYIHTYKNINTGTYTHTTLSHHRSSFSSPSSWPGVWQEPLCWRQQYFRRWSYYRRYPYRHCWKGPPGSIQLSVCMYVCMCVRVYIGMHTLNGFAVSVWLICIYVYKYVFMYV